jgi:hypothetical protein
MAIARKATYLKVYLFFLDTKFLPASRRKTPEAAKQRKSVNKSLKHSVVK